jgi:hypothetical protein
MVVLVPGCGPTDPGGGADDGGISDGASDGSVTPDGADGDGGAPLTLAVETPDGPCADLSITDRGTYAMRFTATGPAGATVELWAEKPACAVSPFLYRELVLDGAGQAVLDLNHTGSTGCADNLLGRWRTWLEHDGAQSNTADAVFASAACVDVLHCASAHDFCPPDPPTGPLIPVDQLFVLTAAERALFTPPPNWLNWGTNYEDYPLRNLWEAFDAGQPVVPLDPTTGPAGWYQPDGAGSQNHSLLWLGVAALGYALVGDVSMYETAAANCLIVLGLDTLQGHMRHEAVGQYAGFWEGGIATMALAGLYAPAGSISGPDLLAAARSWWDDHVAVFRRLSLPDGQVALIGARIPGDAGTEDSWASLSAAVNLQLLDPRPHGQLHPTIANLVTANGEPAQGTGGVPVVWHRPRHVSERWVVLRAIQSGALLPVPPAHPPPDMVQDVFRWIAGNVTHTATPAITGYRPARWHVSWAPGTVLRVEIGDPASTPLSGKGPHLPPQPLNIPPNATQILGTGI